MNAAARLQGINRTLGILDSVEASLSLVDDPPGNVKFKRGVEGCLMDLKQLLIEWANTERERLA